MNIKIHSTNFDIASALEAYVDKKISTLSKFLAVHTSQDEQDITCEVELGKSTNHHKSGDIFRAEVNIVLKGQNQFYAVAEESDLYAAIDVVRDQIEREIISQKNKQLTVFRHGAAKVKALMKRLYFK